MEAHADNLRAEANDDAFVDTFKRDWRSAPLTPADRALLEYADALTRAPWAIQRDDLDRLRARGWTDEQISDAAQVIGYFNYINRIADGLGVDPEDFMPPRAEHPGAREPESQ